MSQETLELILSELRAFRSEVKQEFQALRSEIKGEIQAVRTELKDELPSVGSEIMGEIQSAGMKLKDKIKAFRSEYKDEFQTIHSEFQIIRKNQQAILSRLNNHEKQLTELNEIVKSIKEIVEGISKKLDSQEWIFPYQLNKHAARLVVLNREQLMIKTEIEMLKNQY